MAATLQQIRRFLAASLDDLEGPYIVSADSGTSHMRSLELINGTFGASTTKYDQRWVYLATGAQAGAQRRAQTNGYVPASGQISIYPPWSIPAVGVEVDLTGLFPCSAPPGGPSYRSFINAAAGKIVRPERLTVPIVAGQQEYTFSQHANWLTDPAQVLDIYDPARATGFPRPRSRMRRGEGWTFEVTGGLPTLRFIDRAYPSAGGLAFEIEVMRPLRSRVNDTESIYGLVNETDTIEVSIEDIVEVAKAEALYALMTRQRGQPTFPQAERVWTAQLEMARRVRGYSMAQEPPEARQVAA